LKQQINRTYTIEKTTADQNIIVST